MRRRDLGLIQAYSLKEGAVVDTGSLIATVDFDRSALLQAVTYSFTPEGVVPERGPSLKSHFSSARFSLFKSLSLHLPSN